MTDYETAEPQNEEDFHEIDLALWRALQKSTTLISSGRLTTNDDTGKDESANII